MTLEEAIEQAERIHAAYVDHSGTEPRNQPCCRDAAVSALALGYLLAVARAFPKMLEALERMLTERGCAGCVADAPYVRGQNDRLHEEQHQPTCVNVPAMRALRAAREALGPVTPPQRCTDTVTAWLDEGDQTVERENTCGHVLPCPLHTPRAAREPVPAESAHEYVEWPRPEYLPGRRDASGQPSLQGVLQAQERSCQSGGEAVSPCPDHERMMKTAMEREGERLEWTRKIALALTSLPTMDAAAVLMVALPPKYLRAIENAIGTGVKAAEP